MAFAPDAQQIALMRIVAAQASATSADLVNQFNLTPVIVESDLDKLEEAGLVSLSYGPYGTIARLQDAGVAYLASLN